MLATMQTLDVNKEISPESVTLMEKASVAFPTSPASPETLLLGAIAGLGLALVVLLLLDRLDDRVVSFTELQEIFEEQVVGQIPRERPAKKHGQLDLIKQDDPRFGLRRGLPQSPLLNPVYGGIRQTSQGHRDHQFRAGRRQVFHRRQPRDLHGQRRLASSADRCRLAQRRFARSFQAALAPRLVYPRL